MLVMDLAFTFILGRGTTPNPHPTTKCIWIRIMNFEAKIRSSIYINISALGSFQEDHRSYAGILIWPLWSIYRAIYVSMCVLAGQSGTSLSTPGLGFKLKFHSAADGVVEKVVLTFKFDNTIIRGTSTTSTLWSKDDYICQLRVICETDR